MRAFSNRFSLAFLFVVCATTPQISHAQRVYVDPDQATFGVGDTIIATIRLDPADTCVNALDINVSYPKDVLRVVDFGRGQSILSLWIDTPQMQGNPGEISFSGGIPGGYCGRIPGDPALSNVLGKLVFTVMKAEPRSAELTILPTSIAYLSDGLGTPVELPRVEATYVLADASTQTENPWLTEVGEDQIPPEPFAVEVSAVREFFGATYYLVFSTVDKQSGIDYYEYYENGGWKIIESPFHVRNLVLLNNLQLRAVDKAGNVRDGTFSSDDIPSYEFGIFDYLLLFAGALILFVLGFASYRRVRLSETVPDKKDQL